MEIVNLNLNKHKIEIEKIFQDNISSIYHEIILFNENNLKHNFLIFENNQLLAFVPLSIEIDENSIKTGTFFNLSIPGPVILNDVDNKKFKKILILILDEIDKRCLNEKVKTIKINFSDLIKFNTNSQKFFILSEILISKNYINKSFLGLRINLKEQENQIFKKFSKGHKSEIKKQETKKYTFKNFKDEEITYDNFKRIITNHIDNEKYLEPLYEIYKKNKITIAYENKNENFSSMFSVISNTVEYFIDSKFTKNHHSLIFETIKFFKTIKNLEYLNLGVINNFYNIEIDFPKKKQNIATFKKGFGGEKYLLSIFEKKYF